MNLNVKRASSSRRIKKRHDVFLSALAAAASGPKRPRVDVFFPSSEAQGPNPPMQRRSRRTSPRRSCPETTSSTWCPASQRLRGAGPSMGVCEMIDGTRPLNLMPPQIADIPKAPITTTRPLEDSGFTTRCCLSCA